MKTGAKTQSSLKYYSDTDYCLKVSHAVDIYIYMYIYIHIHIITDVPDTSGQRKNDIGGAKGGPKSTPPSQLQHPPSSTNLDDDDNHDDHDTTKDDVATLQSELKKPESLWKIDHIFRLLSITYGNKRPLL